MWEPPGSGTATPQRARAVADVVGLLHDVERFRRRVDVAKDALVRSDEGERDRRLTADEAAVDAAEVELAAALDEITRRIEAVSTPAQRAGVLAFDDPAWSSASPAPGPTPGLLRIGTLDVAVRARPVPAVVPSHRNLVLRADDQARALALDLVRVLVLRALSDVDAGLVRVLVVDLESVGRPLNVFGALRDTTPPLVAFAVDPDDALGRVRGLEARVHELIVGPLRDGRTLAEHDLDVAPERREHHTIVVLPHGVRGLGEPLTEHVLRLGRNGPVAGVTLLAVMGRDASPVADAVEIDVEPDGRLRLRDGATVVGPGRVEHEPGQHVYDGLLNAVRHAAASPEGRGRDAGATVGVRPAAEGWSSYLGLVHSIDEVVDAHRRRTAQRAAVVGKAAEESVAALVTRQAEVVRLERVANRIRATTYQLASSLEIDPPPYDGAVPPLVLHDMDAMLASLRREAEELGVRLDAASAATDGARVERRDQRDRGRWAEADEARYHHRQRAIAVLVPQVVLTLAAGIVLVIRGGFLVAMGGLVVASLLAVGAAATLGNGGARYATARLRPWASAYHPDDLDACEPDGIVALRLRATATIALVLTAVCLLARAVLGARLVPIVGLPLVLAAAIVLREQWSAAVDEVRTRSRRYTSRRP